MTDPASPRPKPARYVPAYSQDKRLRTPSSGVRGAVVAGVIAAVVIGVGAIAGSVLLVQADRTPREWAFELQKPEFAEIPFTDAAASLLNQADRLGPGKVAILPAALGASAERSGPVPEGRLRLVASLQELGDAAANAEPGDIIQIQPGQYHFSGRAIHLSRPGTPSSPITLRAARLGEVTIESDGLETLKVTGPYWRIENLTMRGVCDDHSQCEHAIHVVNDGSHVLIRNNMLIDYNAHIKINGEGGLFPDSGVFEGNTLTDTTPRLTANPVAPVDLVAASNWRIRSNIITDFVRGDFPGEPAYGGFVKGEGEGNVLERNLVVCEWNLRNVPGQHVGLSIGGGGTGMEFRRALGATGLEQVGGVVRDNLVARCSDDGIYLNRAARSVVDHNTLLDTAGIDARFVETSATVTANLVDGTIRSRDGAIMHGQDNDWPFLLNLFAGLHPQRSYFRDPAALDLAWAEAPSALADSETRADLCGRRRTAEAPAGAFVDYALCAGGQ